MSEDQPKPNYYATIIADVRYCKDLEPSAKLLYGEISALSNREGFCWAKNSYFSDLYDVDDRTITRWMKSLSDAGFIEIETRKEGMKWHRKIWIKEMFTNRQKCPDRTDNFVGIERTKMSTEYNKYNTTKDNNKASFFSNNNFVWDCLKDLPLSPDQKLSLMKGNHTETQMYAAVQYSTHPRTKIKTTLIQTIQWALVHEPGLPKSIDDFKKRNASMAKQLEKVLPEAKGVTFQAYSQYCEIAYSSAPCSPKVFNYDSGGFYEQLAQMIKKAWPMFNFHEFAQAF